ncbi:MAG TPA: hypothetical protein VKY33_06530 [Flavobacterium sp.]|nr:hypothetical protein [Flavobacterium sp.]
MMKNLKKIALSVLGVAVLTVGLVGCSGDEGTSESSSMNEDSITTTNSIKSGNQSFDSVIKDMFLIDSYRLGDKVVNSEYQVEAQDIIVKGDVVGSLAFTNDGDFGVLDVRNTDTEYKYFDSKTNFMFLFVSKYNNEAKRFIPDFENTVYYEVRKDPNPCQTQLTLCTATCTLAAIAVAASDGPSPFMDVVAITGWTTCNGACISVHADCVENRKKKN